MPTLKAEIQIPFALELLKSGEVLLLDKNGRIASYNFITNKLKHLPVHYLSHGNYNQIVCKRSIVSAKTGNKFESKDELSQCPLVRERNLLKYTYQNYVDINTCPFFLANKYFLVQTEVIDQYCHFLGKYQLRYSKFGLLCQFKIFIV